MKWGSGPAADWLLDSMPVKGDHKLIHDTQSISAAPGSSARNRASSLTSARSLSPALAKRS